MVSKQRSFRVSSSFLNDLLTMQSADTCLKGPSKLLVVLHTLTLLWSSATPSAIHIFAGVLSAPQNVQHRQALRRTWGSDSRIQLMFVLSRPTDARQVMLLHEESKQHDDFVVVGQSASYRDITWQTLDVFRLGARHKTATHILKCDDDSYVNVDLLIARLSALPHSQLVLGHMLPPYKPIRQRNHLWHTTPEQWPHGKAGPRYPMGAGYVATTDITGLIAVGLPFVNGTKMFVWEDVAFGMWVDYMQTDLGMNITMHHDASILYRPGRCVQPSGKGCDLSEATIVHKVGPRAMDQLHACKRLACPSQSPMP